MSADSSKLDRLRDEVFEMVHSGEIDDSIVETIDRAGQLYALKNFKLPELRSEFSQHEDEYESLEEYHIETDGTYAFLDEVTADEMDKLFDVYSKLKEAALSSNTYYSPDELLALIKA